MFLMRTVGGGGGRLAALSCGMQSRIRVERVRSPSHIPRDGDLLPSPPHRPGEPDAAAEAVLAAEKARVSV